MGQGQDLEMEMIHNEPVALSPRAEKQVRDSERKIERFQALIVAQTLRINSIAERDRALADEDDKTMSERLRRIYEEQGYRQVRYLITGNRKKEARTRKRGALTQLRAFDLIYRRWKQTRERFKGVRIPISDFHRIKSPAGKGLGLSRSQVFKVLNDLENHTVHWRPGSKMPCRGVILRLGQRDEMRFVVTLPESTVYCEVLLDSMERSVKESEARLYETVEHRDKAA